MVRYQKPVFRNGHYVLWHGAWRGGVRAFRAAAVKPEPHEAVRPESPEAAKSKQDFVILVDGADAAATRMAGELAAATQDGPLHMRAAPGRSSTAALEKTSGADGADLAIVATDGLIAAASPSDKISDWRAKNPYLLRLCSEPIEVVASRGITDIGQLAGRKVAVGPADGAAAASAAIVFSRLNVAPTLVHEDMPQALAGLAAGSLDALFIVGAESSRTLAEFDKGGRFHVVSIPFEPALQGLYQPVRLTAREQPELIGQDERVDTIGVTTALVAIDAAPQSPRAERLAPLAGEIFRIRAIARRGPGPEGRQPDGAHQWMAAARCGATLGRGKPERAERGFRRIPQHGAIGWRRRKRRRIPTGSTTA